MRFLRSPLILLFLSSVACTWNERDEDGCSGCASGHSYSGSSPTPAHVTVAATVSKLVLANGDDYRQDHAIEVTWSGDVFTLLRPSSPEGTDAGDGGEHAFVLADASVASDASAPCETCLEDGGSDAGTGTDPGAGAGDAGADDAGDAGVAPDSRAFGRITTVSGTLNDGTSSSTTYERSLPLRVVLCAVDQRLTLANRCLDARGHEVDADVFTVEARAASDYQGGRSVQVRDERIDLDAYETHYAATPGTPDGTECY